MTTIYDAERRDISIALGGDAMITRRMRAFQEPRFLKLVDILRGADVSLVNLEMLFHDFESSWQWSSATYTRSDPHNLDELKWMGINAVTAANNHSFDYSEGGFLTTLEHCREIDLPYAGGGRDLDEARAPAYVDSARGRVAVMGATSTYSEQSRAGAGRPDFRGRPGVNALRHDITHHVQQDVFDALRKANLELGYEEEHAFHRHFGFRGNENEPDHSTEIEFLESKFICGRRVCHPHRTERGGPPGHRQLDSGNAENSRTGRCTASIATRAALTATSTATPACRRPTS